MAGKKNSAVAVDQVGEVIGADKTPPASTDDTLGVGAHRKSAFRLVYLIVMIWTLWEISSALIRGIYLPERAPKLLEAFAGPGNISIAQIVIAIFLISAIGYLFISYVIMECFEENIGKISSDWNSNTTAKRIEFMFRVIAISIIVIGTKKLSIDGYASALFFLWIASLGYVFWFLFLYFSSEKRFLILETTSNLCACLCYYFMYYLSTNPNTETHYGLGILVLMMLCMALIIRVSIYWIISEYGPMQKAIGKYLGSI